jgi:hypothetical protein
LRLAYRKPAAQGRSDNIASVEDDPYDWKAHISIELLRLLLEIADDLDTIQRLRTGDLPDFCLSMEEAREHLSRSLQELPDHLEGHESISDLLGIVTEEVFMDASLVRTEADDGDKILLSIAREDENDQS